MEKKPRRTAISGKARQIASESTKNKLNFRVFCGIITAAAKPLSFALLWLAGNEGGLPARMQLMAREKRLLETLAKRRFTAATNAT